MSPNGDSCRMTMSSRLREVPDFSERAALACGLRSPISRMRARSSLLLAVLLAVAAVLLATALVPARYAATGRVLSPRAPFDPAAFAAEAAGHDLAARPETGRGGAAAQPG